MLGRVLSWASLALRTSVALQTGLLAAFIFLPYLGTVGLWDPWETHYSEVGREMLERGDLVHPYWEHAWFFSKPPLTPWLAAVGLWLSGSQTFSMHLDGALPVGVEWAIRLPFALLAIAAVALLSEAVARLHTKRAGQLTGLVLSTMPLFFFTARQAMTDMPFVACITITAAAQLIAEHPSTTSPRGWWRVAFVATGLGLLGKGLLAGLPWVVLATTWVVSSSTLGELLGRVRKVPWRGALLTAVIAVPWYWAMVQFTGRDEEGRLFWQRFFIYDHLERLLEGVHTTTPGGTFTYFIEQLGFGIFPWVALVPAAVQVGVEKVQRPIARWGLVWGIGSFALFSASATKFHHYILPMLPGLAVLLALAVEALLEEPKRLRVSLALGAVMLGLVTRDLSARPRHFLDLFTYNYTRPYPDGLLLQPLWGNAPSWLTLKVGLIFAVSLAGLAAVRWYWQGDGKRTVWAVTALALSIACFLSWKHWTDLGVHWTQRVLVDRYFAQRGPGEPLGAFLMNWKGETFYSRNTAVQFGNDSGAALAEFVARGGHKWFIVEHERVPVLRNAVGPNHPLTVVDQQSTNKFALVEVD